jgi:hypothetical protein
VSILVMLQSVAAAMITAQTWHYECHSAPCCRPHAVATPTGHTKCEPHIARRIFLVTLVKLRAEAYHCCVKRGVASMYLPAKYQLQRRRRYRTTHWHTRHTQSPTHNTTLHRVDNGTSWCQVP